MTGESPIAELHQLGATFHQTNPLRKAGYTTVEQAAELIQAHRDSPEGSTLSTLSGISQRRIDFLVAAIEAWNDRQPAAEVGERS